MSLWEVVSVWVWEEVVSVHAWEWCVGDGKYVERAIPSIYSNVEAHVHCLQSLFNSASEGVNLHIKRRS